MTIKDPPFEGKYYVLKSEKESFSERANGFEHELQQLRKKCSQLEVLQNGENQREMNGWERSTNRGRIEREEQDYISILQNRNDALVKDQRNLRARHKSAMLTIKNYKKELCSLRRRHSCPPGMTGKVSTGGCNQGVKDKWNNKSEKQNTLQQLQKKLAVLEKENQQLKEEEKHNESSDSNHEQKFENNEMLKRSLEQLKVKYSHLENKTLAQSHLQKQSLLKLEQCNRYINDLKQSKTAMEIISLTSNERKKQVEELTEQNIFLEEQFTKLCEYQFLEKECVKSNNDTNENGNKYEQNESEREKNNFKEVILTHEQELSSNHLMNNETRQNLKNNLIHGSYKVDIERQTFCPGPQQEIGGNCGFPKEKLTKTLMEESSSNLNRDKKGRQNIEIDLLMTQQLLDAQISQNHDLDYKLKCLEISKIKRKDKRKIAQFK